VKFKIKKGLTLLSAIVLSWQSASVHALDTGGAELAITNGISDAPDTHIPNLTEFVTPVLPDSPYSAPIFDITMMVTGVATGRLPLTTGIPVVNAVSEFGTVVNTSLSIQQSLDKINESGGSSANGGVVIYPGKINTNTLTQVYEK